MNSNGAGQHYKKIGNQTGVVDADPHRLIQMLFAGALESIAKAKGCIGRGDAAGKGEAIGKAVSIVGGLNDSLNHDVDAKSLTDNLRSLYEFVTSSLTKANLQNDAEALDQAANVLRELQAGWNDIRPTVIAEKDSPQIA
jgi:flagellar protein FliS